MILKLSICCKFKLNVTQDEKNTIIGDWKKAVRKAKNFPILRTSQKVLNNLLVWARRRSIYLHRIAHHQFQRSPPKYAHFYRHLPPLKNFHFSCHFHFPKNPVFIVGVYTIIKILDGVYMLCLTHRLPLLSQNHFHSQNSYFHQNPLHLCNYTFCSLVACVLVV